MRIPSVRGSLIVGFLLLVLAPACGPVRFTVEDFNAVGTAVPIGSHKPLVATNAPKELIHLYFPGEDKGDLYIGYVSNVRLVAQGGSNAEIYITFSDGTMVSPGYMPKQAGLGIGLKCQAMLFLEHRHKVILTAIRDCQ